jgi:hypothetical protein
MKSACTKRFSFYLPPPVFVKIRSCPSIVIMSCTHNLRYLFFTILGLFLLTSSAQRLTAQTAVVWGKTGALSNGSSQSISGSTDLTGNAYVTGNFRGTTATFGSNTLQNSDSTTAAFFLTKYNSSGQVLWALTAKTGNGSTGQALATDKNGNVFLAGRMGMTGTFAIDSISVSVNKPGELFVAKFNSAGRILWMRTAGRLGDTLSSISTDSSGNSYLAGSVSGLDSTFLIDSISLAKKHRGMADAFLVKLNPAGHALWIRNESCFLSTHYYTNTACLIHSVYTNPAGFSCIAGRFAGDTLVIGQDTLANNSASGKPDIFLAKYTPSGVLVWATRFGGSDFDDCHSVCMDSIGNTYATGNFRSPVISFGANTFSNSGGDDFFVLKLNPTGAVVWAKAGGGTNDEVGYSIATDPTGNCFVSGAFGTRNPIPSYTISIGSYPLYCPVGSTDPAFILKLGPAGNPLNALTFQTGGFGGLFLACDRLFQNTYFCSSSEINGLRLGTDTLSQLNFNKQFGLLAKWTMNSNNLNCSAFTVPAAYCGSTPCNGLLSVHPAGGLPPYTYNWIPSGQHTQSLSGVCSGTDTVYVTDASSSTVSCIVHQMNSPVLPILNTVVHNQTCNTLSSSCDGSIALSASGGKAPYTFYPTNPSNLCAGTYTVTVTDSMSCTTSKSVLIKQPTLFSTTFSSTQASCGTCADGTATCTLSGGVPPFSYSWNPGGIATSTLNNLPPGSYQVSVTDSNLCTAKGGGTITFGTGIQEYTQQGLSIFPNPANEHIHLQFPVGFVPSSVRMSDETGRLVKEYKNLELTDLSISILPPGLYILTVEGNGHSMRSVLIKN